MKYTLLILVNLLFTLPVMAGLDSSYLYNTDKEQIARDAKDFERQKNILREIGVNVNEDALDYLVLELYYNISGREILLEMDAHPEVIELEMDGSKLLTPLAIEPSNTKGSEDLTKFKAIKISGHNSYFVWHPERPDFYFTIKKSSTDTKQFNDYLDPSQQNKPLVEVVPEHALNLDPSDEELQTDILRPLNNIINDSDGSKIYPFHGFLGSYKLAELARQNGRTVYDYYKSVIVPQLSDLIFIAQFEYGLHFSAHTQNLWIRVDPSGEVSFIFKDLTDILVDGLFVKNTLPGWEMHSWSKQIQDSFGLEDNPRARDPGFHLISYTLQSVGNALPLNDWKEELQFSKIFIERMKLRISQMIGKDIELPPDVYRALININNLSHPFDIKMSEPTGTGFTTRLSGPQTLIMRAYNYLYNEVVAAMSSERNYPKSSDDQDNLKRMFHGSPFKSLFRARFPATGLSMNFSSPSVGERANSVLKLWYNLFSLPVRIVWYLMFKNQSYHFEENDKFIFMVSNHSGEILGAARKGTIQYTARPLYNPELHSQKSLGCELLLSL